MTFNIPNDKDNSIDKTLRFLEDHSPFKRWLEDLNLSPYFDNSRELFLKALTHTSFTHENPNWELGNNERLEFIGDAFLDVEISLILFKKFPDLKEGNLSKLRSSIVNEDVLSGWASLLGIAPFLFLGKGESQKESVEKAILADAFEALIGAVGLIDKNAPKLVINHWINLYDQRKGEGALGLIDSDRLDLFDPKTRLQELTLEKFKSTPTYECVEIPEGFEVEVFVEGKSLEKAQGKSKKKAEIKAAKNILTKKLIQNWR